MQKNSKFAILVWERGRIFEFNFRRRNVLLSVLLKSNLLKVCKCKIMHIWWIVKMEAVFRTVTKVKDYINVTIIFYIEVSMTTKIRYLWGFLFSFCLNFLKKVAANLNCFQSRYILLFSCDVCCCCCWSRIPKLAPSSLAERYCPTSSSCPSVS